MSGVRPIGLIVASHYYQRNAVFIDGLYSGESGSHTIIKLADLDVLL